MPYFSTSPDGLGEFGCGADCSCKSCRKTAASNLGEVYEREEVAPSAPATPPAAPKIGGWLGEPPLAIPCISVVPGQLRMPPFEILIGYAPGQWRLDQARFARIQRLAEHIVRAWTTASPVAAVRLIGFAELPEARAGVQRAVAARAALMDAIRRLNSGFVRAIQFGAEEGDLAPASIRGWRRVEIFLWIGPRTLFAPPVKPFPVRVPLTRVTPPDGMPRPAEVARSVYESQRFGEPKKKNSAPRGLTVRAEFVIRTTTVPYVNGDPFTDGEIRIIIWDGAGNRILWPPKREFISASKVGGVISSPPLSGIESNEIAIMALVRFGGSSGRTHQITGLFPLPTSDKFTLTVYVDLKAAKIQVKTAKTDEKVVREARAKLALQAKIINDMIRSSTLIRTLDTGGFQVELEHFTGTLGFHPSPKQILGRQ